MISTELVNIALDQINEGPIANIDGADSRSQKAKRGYEFILPVVLEDSPWSFANRRASLPADAAAPISDFLFQYPLPPDCIRSRTIDGAEPPDVLWSEESGKILTNETSPIILEYTFKQTDLNKWSPTALNAFSIYLASHYAKSFKSDQKLSDGLLNQYVLLALPVARTINAQKRSPKTPTTDTLTTAVRKY